MRLTPTRLLVVMVGTFTIAALCAALALGSWSKWAPILLMVVPGLAAWAVRRASLLAAIYLAQVAICFGLTDLILGQDRPPALVTDVVLWSLGVAVGAIIGHRKNRGTQGTRRDPPRWPQFVLTGALVAVQIYLLLSARLGYAAQLSVGLSSPTGVLGLLAAAGPVVSLMLLITALCSGRFVAGAAVVAILQAIVLSLTGFKGTAGILAIAVLAAAALTLPEESPWRRPGRVAAGITVLSIFAVGGYFVGAGVRSVTTAELGLQSPVIGSDQALAAVVSRLDLATPLQQGILYQNNPSVKAALSWTSQIVAFVPRFLWPDKPIIDYGQSVSVTVYGLPHGESSSTITTIGDAIVNFQTPGVVVISLLLGLGLAVAEGRIRKGAGLLSLAFAAVLAYSIVGLEAPIIVQVAGVVRDLLIVVALWGASRLLTSS